MKAVFLDYASLDQHDLNFTQLQQLFHEWETFDRTEADQVLERVKAAHVIISNKVMLNAETLAQCPELQLILISATGTNNVDLVAARERGIVVCNCQGYGTAAVAQHTLMFMLNLATSMQSYQQDIAQGKWQQSSQFCLLNAPIIELSGKKLGILGFGELGQAVAKLAEAFGMHVLVGALPSRMQAGRIALDELLAQVDFLSLHCPLTEETRNLIARDQLKAMKSSAFLINCARGGIVHEADLAHALMTGEIAGAATDVLSVEPPKEGNVLLNSAIPNLLITPHSAWGSVDARQRIVQQMVENTQAFLQGQPIRQVN